MLHTATRWRPVPAAATTDGAALPAAQRHLAGERTVGSEVEVEVEVVVVVVERGRGVCSRLGPTAGRPLNAVFGFSAASSTVL